MADKKTPPTKITGVVHSLLDGLHSMSKSETIIGDPYQLGDATLVPVHRLKVALGAGAIERSHLVSEAAEVGAEDRRRDQRRALGAGHGGRSLARNERWRKLVPIAPAVVP